MHLVHELLVVSNDDMGRLYPDRSKWGRLNGLSRNTIAFPKHLDMCPKVDKMYPCL